MSIDPTQPLPTTPDKDATSAPETDETVVLEPVLDGSTDDLPADGDVFPDGDALPDASMTSPADPAAGATFADGSAPDARATGAAPDAGTTGYVPSAEAAGAYPPPAWTPPADPPREVSTSVRSSTIVWGAILVVAGVVLAASAAGFTLDVGLVAIVALAGAGLALLVGALTSALRRNRRERTR
ncbi:hypothetical protein [Sanguibacter sp. HDW7]|uniref:hypothetical protein n=1 Tax=Sanguibacter sp. HDW7 TaxID=2714931 RepID=UPI00140B9292|nr:hypothetical protein [Sanguibacter sp. HDW7]QIK82803.1 hypothetical protein G7063_03565 [Sanguibacter sp. HDW7]